MEVVYARDPAPGEKELAPLLENGVAMNDYMMMQTQEDATFAHGINSTAAAPDHVAFSTSSIASSSSGLNCSGRVMCR
jgi:hypothetical protein